MNSLGGGFVRIQCDDNVDGPSSRDANNDSSRKVQAYLQVLIHNYIDDLLSATRDVTCYVISIVTYRTD